MTGAGAPYIAASRPRPLAATGAGPSFLPVLRLSALDLAPLPSAVTSARLHARHVVGGWFPAVAGDAELIVAELVGNAVMHGSVPAGAAVPVGLRLSGRGRGVLIEVRDASDAMPVPVPGLDPGADGGRGLVLVAALSDRWGAYRTRGGGKCVYAVIGR
jgi:anti-sigma regulatory factor (Ser/Thr protein kinase)